MLQKQVANSHKRGLERSAAPPKPATPQALPKNSNSAFLGRFPLAISRNNLAKITDYHKIFKLFILEHNSYFTNYQFPLLQIAKNSVYCFLILIIFLHFY